MIADADASEFRVLLVYDTSRFARNELDAYTYENELHRLGITVVYVMERIISSNAETAAIKGMHHVMNAEYSRKLSLRIEDGLREKYEAGYANGHCPFGWSREPDQRTIRPVPSEAPQCSRSPRCTPPAPGASRTWLPGRTASRLTRPATACPGTSSGYPMSSSIPSTTAWSSGTRARRTRSRNPASTRAPDRPATLTAELARVRRDRATIARPSRKHRVYPYTGLMVCSRSGARVAGTPNRHGTPRMIHPSSDCPDKSYHSLRIWDRTNPRDHRREHRAACTWRAQVNAFLRRGQAEDQAKHQRAKLERELERIRNLYKIDDEYSDQEYLRDRHRIQDELAALAQTETASELDEAAKVLADFPRLWRGTSEQTRKGLLATMFEEIRVQRDKVVQVKPRPQYLELVTVAMTQSPPGSSPRGH